MAKSGDAQKPAPSAAGDLGLLDFVACRTCDLIHAPVSLPKAHRAVCSRCGGDLSKYKENSLNRTMALSIAALILYVPANLYPILTMEFFGASQSDTIWTGVVALAQAGMWPIAILVFLASIAIPLIKILGLLFLVATIKWNLWLQRRTKIFRFIDAIGRWSMLDVFLLSILVAVVKLGQLATVEPGLGSLAFAAVVVLTIFAANCFDPKLIWADETSRTGGDLSPNNR